MADVFISYEHTDYPRARRIAEALERRGLTVWWDRKLLAGDAFEETIRKALDAARCVIVLWSKASVTSNWVKDEAGAAAKHDILVPILTENVEIPLGFRQLHAASLFDWEAPGFDATFPDVLESVQHVLARSQRRDALPPASSAGVKRRGLSAGDLLKSPLLIESPILIAAAVAMVIGLIAAGRGYFRSDEPPTTTTSAARMDNAGRVGTGILDFEWPGNDSWSVYRGDERVAILSGSNRQALQVGNYVVKSTFNSAFAPFKVTVRSDSITTIKFGGVLRFNWPGNDSWSIYRGDELVATHSGSDSQALEAGTYVVKPTFNQAFVPFTVRIVDGATVKVP